jgi:predicted transcriptional regulator
MLYEGGAMTGEQSGGGADRIRRGAGALESEVLAALWSSDRPLTVVEVMDSVADKHLAYSTVHTILTRLVGKGLVIRERVGRSDRYAPTRAADDLAAERMHAVLDAGGNRTAVLGRFVERLSRADERALRRLLERRRDQQ